MRFLADAGIGQQFKIKKERGSEQRENKLKKHPRQTGMLFVLLTGEKIPVKTVSFSSLFGDAAYANGATLTVDRFDSARANAGNTTVGQHFLITAYDLYHFTGFETFVN